MSRPRLHLIAICLAALGVRLLAVWSAATSRPAQWFFAQASELARLAENLRAGHGLSSPFGGNTGPSAFLSPGYPAFVAATFAIFHPYSMASAVALMLLQAVFGTLTVLVTMRFAQRFGNHVANLAGIFCALNPPLIFLPTVFWETSLSILLATSLLALAATCAENSARLRCLALGLLSALALAINPSLLTVIASCFLWILLRTRRAAPLAGVLVCVMLSTPWVIRNQRELHALIPLRDNFGYELWQGNRPGSDGFFSASLHPNANASEFQRYEVLGEIDYMQEKLRLAKQFIVTNRAGFVTLSLRRAVYFWEGRGGRSALLIIAPIAFTSILGMAGMLSLAKTQRGIAWLFLFPLVLFPLPYYITHPDFRFRLILEPILDILAAYLLVRLTPSGVETQNVTDLYPTLRNSPSR